MKRASPEAKLIAWPYSQYIVWGEKLTREFAAHVPPGVILQHNFESAGRALQLGKERILNDYWLTWSGPSQLFSDCAKTARAKGNEVSAKLQVSAGYEFSTVPSFLAPGLLYSKFKSIHELGVTSMMESWYVGSFPSLMSWAAGELSFLPFFGNKGEFLLHLARRDWGERAETMVEIWDCFEHALNQLPYTILFAYYSPLHNGVTWPLYLKPKNSPLSPPWRNEFPPSGDRIGECIGDGFTWQEILELMGAMDTFWQRGLKLFESLISHYDDLSDRRKDYQLAQAIGLQIKSALHILEFYKLRDELAYENDRKIQNKGENNENGI